MWYKINDTQVELNIFVKPNAKKTVLIDINDTQGMIIALHAKPQEGEANQELINFLAKFLKIPKSEIILQKGARSRHKKVNVPLKGKLKELIEDKK